MQSRERSGQENFRENEKETIYNANATYAEVTFHPPAFMKYACISFPTFSMTQAASMLIRSGL